MGPHAGSEPSSGVSILRSLAPVTSTCQIDVLPDEPRSLLKNWITRPLGDQLGASSCQLLVSSLSLPPPGLITPILNWPPPILVTILALHKKQLGYLVMVS